MEDVLEVAIQDHIQRFGTDPIILGRYWMDREKTADLIFKAIEDGKPYDEYKSMSKEMREAWDKGELSF